MHSFLKNVYAQDYYNQARQLNVLRGFLSTIDAKTVLVCVAAVIATMFCLKYDIKSNMRTDLLAISVVFPIVFSISSAYKRREDALFHLSVLKGNAFAMRLSLGHLSKEKRNDKRESVMELGDAVFDKLFHDIKIFLSSNMVDQELHARVGKRFVALSLLIEDLRGQGVSTPETARVADYLRVMMVSFQVLKHIRCYSTPAAIRGYTKIFLLFFPVLFGPAFAYTAEDANAVWFGYLLAVVYGLVLSGLDNIQETLENPFDGRSLDDIRFDPPIIILNTVVEQDAKVEILVEDEQDATLVDTAGNLPVDNRARGMTLLNVIEQIGPNVPPNPPVRGRTSSISKIVTKIHSEDDEATGKKIEDGSKENIGLSDMKI